MITINCRDDNPETVTHIFNNIASTGINVDIISQARWDNNVNICFTISIKDVEKAIHTLSEIKNVKIQHNIDICKITIEGKGMETQPGIAAEIFNIFASQSVKVLAVSTSETKISCIIDKKDQKIAVESVIREFEL
ncbi:MAG: ACT domain-containing protein [Clostridia bacterium]|nr:ACT domain-containing protein [Clostridia bacterium]